MRFSFASRQLAFVLKSIPGRRSLKHLAKSPVDLASTIRRLRVVERALSQPPLDRKENWPECSVVLLSHNRPFNMDTIVKLALRSGVPSRIVVSNSNPNVRISDWVSVADERLSLIDDGKVTRTGHRFAIARGASTDFFLAVDDDFFLTPKQWADFFSRLVANPSVPHCFRGNDYLENTVSSNGSPFHHVQGVTRETDVLIGSYAFHRSHVDRMVDLSNRLGFEDISQMPPVEDIVMSFAGNGRPWIHDLGEIVACASESLEGIALWKTHNNFWQQRVNAYKNTQRLARDLFPQWWAQISI
jgi:hypothetical protein